MKKLITLWLFTCVCLFASAQVITITDKTTSQPLEMVSLISTAPKAQAITNAEGQADISAFNGASRIEINLIGYTPLFLSYNDLQSVQFIITLEYSDISTGGVVVSATRWSQQQRDIPTKILRISPRETALQNPQTAADLLSASGEVFVQKSQLGGGSPMIRGFATNRVLIAIDGVRMNTAIFRSGNVQNIISLDPFAIENTEVFFGPGSVIYGSDAIGGVMSFQTLTPQLSVQESDSPLVSGKAVSRFSSANSENTGHFDVNVGWKKFAMATSFTYTDFDDLRMGRNGPEEYLRPFYVQRQDSVDVVVTNDDPLMQRPTGYSQTNLMQKFRFTPNNKWDFQYGFHYSTTTAYPRYDRHIRLRNGLPRSAEWNYGPQVWLMNNLSITHHGSNKAYDYMTLRLAHQFFEESRIERNLNDPTRLMRMEEVTAYSVNLDFTKTSNKHNFYYGLELVTNDITSTGTDEDITTHTVVAGPSRYPQSEWASYAAYLTYQYRITDALLLQAGARYNQFMLDATFDTTFYDFPFKTADINNGALTGSLGLAFSPNDKLTIRLNGSSGFRSPNVDDVGKVFDSEPGSVVIPNPDLNSETAYNAELGITKIFGDFLKLDVTGYYTILQDALVRRDFTLNGQDSILYDGELSQVQAIQNAAVATVYGVQAGLELRLPAGFGFRTLYNYQLGEEELDDGSKSPLRHAAPWFGVSHLTLTRKGLKLDLYAQYAGEVSFEDLPEEAKETTYIYAVDKNGNPYSPDWYTLNFKAMYKMNNNFTLSGGVENITDQRYRPYSSGIVAPGRNLILALRADF